MEDNKNLEFYWIERKWLTRTEMKKTRNVLGRFEVARTSNDQIESLNMFYPIVFSYIGTLNKNQNEIWILNGLDWKFEKISANW